MKLIEKTVKLIRNMRWRALAFLQPKENTAKKENYGFNSTRTPPVTEELKVFESEMEEMIRDIEFKNDSNSFQAQLTKDAKKIKKPRPTHR